MANFSTLFLFLLSLLLLKNLASLSPPCLVAYDEPTTCTVNPIRPTTSTTTSDSVPRGSRILDITHPYRVGGMPAWASSDGLGQFIWLHESMANGSLYNMSELRMVVHSGTHVDAPGHMYQEYFEEGYDVDSLDLEVLNGPALVVDVPRDKNITAEVMESLHIPRGVRRVIFRTLNTDRKLMWKREYDTSYVGFMKDGAQWLVDNTDIKLVGVDYLSVAAFDESIPAHLVFLKSRCVEIRNIMATKTVTSDALSSRTEP
ncbi:Kynurenine formamidase [Carex littledalei]|uniref:Kynurenine formamidase n=1 Tax=Carex littledalei TaxID=544730 RepID=A0A833V985_9POAL|nr:Kynurenine formamidase [Carex littledalei]